MLPVLSVLALAAGCTSLSQSAQRQLDSGLQKYQAQDNVGAVAEMDAFLRENPHSARTDEALYLRGLARYNLHQYENAKADLLQAISITKNPELRGKAALAQGALSFETGDPTLAENMYRLATASLPPNSDLIAQAYYRLGEVLQREGQWRAADQQFHKAIYYFPDTEPGRRSARAINSNAWTVQAGSYARMSAAQAGATRFTAGGMPATAVALRADNATRFVIQIGRYDRFEDAQAMLPKVQSLQKDAFVAPTR
jgi:tetratricopeptide (TPR) repeat protein